MKRLIVKYILFPLVLRNFRKRMNGEIPDKWYWGDIQLFRLGYRIYIDFGNSFEDSLFVLYLEKR